MTASTAAGRSRFPAGGGFSSHSDVMPAGPRKRVCSERANRSRGLLQHHDLLLILRRQSGGQVSTSTAAEGSRIRKSCIVERRDLAHQRDKDPTVVEVASEREGVQFARRRRWVSCRDASTAWGPFGQLVHVDDVAMARHLCRARASASAAQTRVRQEDGERAGRKNSVDRPSHRPDRLGEPCAADPGGLSDEEAPGS
jgi:hypothetical protein